MVPLSALVTTRYVAGPSSSRASTASRRSRSPARRRPASARARRSRRWSEVARRDAAAGFGYAWAGQAREEEQSGGTSALAFVFGLIVVFLLLAAQYEKWTLPVGVVLAVPFAILGALVAIWLRGTRERRLLPGRPGDAGRPGGEERDPDLRVRGELNRKEGKSYLRRGDRGGAAAAAADRDDLVRVHPRLRAARDRHRRVAPTACTRSAPA